MQCLAPQGCRAVPLSLLTAGRPNALVRSIVAGASRSAVQSARDSALEEGGVIVSARLTQAADALFGPGAGQDLRIVADAVEHVADLAHTSRCRTCKHAIDFLPPTQGEPDDCMSMKCGGCKQYVCSMCLDTTNLLGEEFGWDSIHTHVSHCFVRKGLRDNGEVTQAVVEGLGPEATAAARDYVRRNANPSAYLLAQDKPVAVARGRVHRIHNYLVGLGVERGARIKALVCVGAHDALQQVCAQAQIQPGVVGGPGGAYLWNV